ncbi:hypothetical protein [Iamia sp.]|jgi:hypothetical protein|uniref:hypothetical protein n=1 Tax=Iamia sp. TaxID=2722710 RepID=UPI002CF60FFF|nr:hypothetical protein [Iamia sp.]HXH58546.1 hypothetical protein [Iamia sp.]
MAGWGDDPVLAELRGLLYEQGWRPVRVIEATDGDAVEVEGPDGDRRTFTSDHIAFHRFVEGLGEDFDL